MLYYAMHDIGQQFWAPLSGYAKYTANLFSDPLSPFFYLPSARRIAAGFELLHRFGRAYEKPEWGFDEVHINGKAVKLNIETTISKPFCKLLHFKREQSKRPDGDPVVLIVAPLAGHNATLLRDTVQTMASSFDVYVTDWVNAQIVPTSEGTFDLSDYVQYLLEFIGYLGPNLHIQAVCQATVPVMGAVSLLASAGKHDQVKSMILMGGPLDTRLSPGQVNSLATTKSYRWFETQMIHPVPSRYPGAGRLVYPGFMQHMGFVAMNPDSHLKSVYDYFLDLMRGNEMAAEKHRKFYDEYNAVIDLTAEFYLETIKKVFQEFHLPRGIWEVRGQLVEPANIKDTYLMTIEGKFDDITGLGQTMAAHSMCKQIPLQHQQTYLAEKSGHYGIFSGSRWRNEVFPTVEAFIEQAQAGQNLRQGFHDSEQLQAALHKTHAAQHAANMADNAIDKTNVETETATQASKPSQNTGLTQTESASATTTRTADKSQDHDPSVQTVPDSHSTRAQTHPERAGGSSFKSTQKSASKKSSKSVAKKALKTSHKKPL